MAGDDHNLDAADVAKRLAVELEKRGQDYAIGGAIALGYWAEPRGTIDVDLTLFVPPDHPSDCIWLLQEIGCDVNSTEATRSLSEHGFCRVTFGGLRVDVFLPIAAFYELARSRRRRVVLGQDNIVIWDAETLSVFKMMFFRRKDIADVEQILRVQADGLDRVWIREQLVALYGRRDPRIAQWDDLVEETAG